MGMIFNFFATRDEVIEIWDWIGGLDGMRFIEIGSRTDLPCREFSKFPGNEWGSELNHMSINAWPSNAGGVPIPRYIEFNQPYAQEMGTAGRTMLESPALIGIHPLAPPLEDLIGPNELYYWTEKLARNSARFDDKQLDSIDWKLLLKTVESVKRHIRKIAVEKWRSVPVSAGVDKLLKENPTKLWLWGAVGTT